MMIHKNTCNKQLLNSIQKNVINKNINRSSSHYTLHSSDHVFVKEQPLKKVDLSLHYPIQSIQAQTKNIIQNEFWKDLSKAKQDLKQGKIAQTLNASQPSKAPESLSEEKKQKDLTVEEDHSTKIPGFRQEGRIPSNWEVATGLERYEFLKMLAGEDPWEDTRPLVLKERPTVQNPAVVLGVDTERYIGCTGWPVGSHEITWLTLRPQKDGVLDRCPHCGNAFKYIQKSSYLNVHEHHH